jgi:methionyl-tRNA synthetase
MFQYLPSTLSGKLDTGIKNRYSLCMKILVTSALPYANGEVHLGHLAGCYLPADIYTRYQRLKGREVIHIGGTDEHGVPATLKAEAEGTTPRAVVDRYHKSIKESFERFGIGFDNFSRTTLPVHYKLAQDFFLKIYNKGLIEPKTLTQFYCPKCSRFLPDRYVEGTCPHCQAVGARGDQCETCGRWLEPFELLDPRCKICTTTPVKRETTHWFFLLDRFQKPLTDWLATKTGWKDNVLKFCKGWFSEGLQPRAITRDLEWGVPVPLAEAKGKVLYVWFDAPIGYISSTIEWAEKNQKPDAWKEYWFSPDTKLVHFIGKDNIVFHAMVWPAMLMAYGDYILPAEIPANEFLNLEGRPLSTSRNWAVWLPEYLKDFEPDPLRYTLAANLPENRDVDFTWKDFQARNNNELADVFGNFVNRVVLFTKKYYDGKIPRNQNYREADKKIFDLISETTKNLSALIERFELKNGLKEVMRLAAEGNRYFDYQAPWHSIKTDPDACALTIGTCFKIISALEILAQPYLPFTAGTINEMLNLGRRQWDEARDPALPQTLGVVKILFNKIDDSTIDAQIAKLTKKEEAKVEIPFDDFKKLELRVAKIVSAAKVEGADKLLRLQVDLGSETREIVAGIAQVYPPETLVGKSVVLVANLAPAKIRGLVSHGMLLAATDGSTISLVTLDKEIPPGTSVS